MKAIDALQVEAKPVVAPDAHGVQIQWLIDETHGAPGFAMRRFVVEPGGQTPSHTHHWEHEVYILAGVGEVVTSEGAHALDPDMAVLVPPGETHQFRAVGEEPLIFLCLVPLGPATAR